VQNGRRLHFTVALADPLLAQVQCGYGGLDMDGREVSSSGQLDAFGRLL
jgi:hypothetical protein